MLFSQFPPMVDNHVAKYRGTDGEKAWFDEILRVYRGEFWTGQAGKDEPELAKTSTNLVFAIVDTSLSTLIAPNPQVSAIPRNRSDQARVASAEGVVNLALDEGKYRRELTTATFQAVLYGRGITKTVWDQKRDLPIVRALDVRNVFFDQTATRPEDIRYWIEATLVSPKEYRKRCKNEYAANPRALEYEPDHYPAWMVPDKSEGLSETKLKDWQKWYLIYECYDLEDGRVYHYCAGHPDAPLLDEEMLYLPYDIVTFNSNGQDCRGLSEIGLILPNQKEYNYLSTFLHNIVRYQISRIAVDSSAIPDAQKINDAPLGSMVPLDLSKLRSATGSADIRTAMQEIPVVHAQPEQIDLLSRLREGIAYVSALADAQRGQVVGAKTATELALIEGQLRNRLRNRQGQLDDLTENVAAKILLLASRFMREEKVLRITGETGWKSIDPWSLEGVNATFKVVPYSPMESNKAVKAEIMRSMIEFFVNNPNIDQRNFFYEVLRMLDLPANLLVTQPAGGPPLPMGMPAGAVPPAAPPEDPNAVPLPPQVQALANAQVPGPGGPVAPGEVVPGGGPVTQPAPV